MSDEEPPKRRMVRPPTGGNDGVGRGKPARLKTAKGRRPSSQAWLERQINDPFSAEARAQGYRSRAAFKLSEIDDRFKLIRKGTKVIDLGCAPGGWVQIALQRGAGRVIGIDLLPVDPLPPAEMVQMDFTDPAAGPLLMEMLGGQPDLVLSDMAPNTVGHRETDHLRIVGLIELASAFAVSVLKPGGSFVAKAFQGGETAQIIRDLKKHFTKVQHVKPKASRADSSEVFLVATGFKG
ncbi:MAG: RlmE family RNA methyltransferase [Caulobacter sp.]|nr:RlmE family RNA methyltransferase [Caulobacter sp.]